MKAFALVGGGAVRLRHPSGVHHCRPFNNYTLNEHIKTHMERLVGSEGATPPYRLP